MANEANDKAGAAAPETQTQTQQPATPPKQEAAPKPEPKQEAAAPKTEPAKETAAPAKGPKEASIGDDDDIPEDAELLRLSPKALQSRLQRHTTRELKERFGTSDLSSIKKDMAELKTLREEKETQRRAALDEKTRLEEDLKKANDRASAAEQRWRATQEERIVDKEETRIKGISEEFIKPKAWKYAARDLAEHLRDNFSKEQLANLKDKDLKKWFEGYVKDNPEFAKEQAAAKKEPLTNGAKDNDRQSSKGAPDMVNKTARPGQPNTMSSAEVAQMFGGRKPW